jgi:hypothetical protein
MFNRFKQCYQERSQKGGGFITGVVTPLLTMLYLSLIKVEIHHEP